jgi:hypothetical protein
MANAETTVVNFALAETVIEAAIRADVVVHVIGDPGIGKSAMVRRIGKRIGKRVVPLILAQCAPEDVGGIPSRDGDRVLRLPVGPIRQACDEGVILFIDEYSQAGAQQQGASLTLINERFAGDAQLHPDTRIVIASNPVETSAGGNDLTAPAAGRMHHIRLVPDIADWQGYAADLGEEESALRALATDYSVTISRSPGLLVMDTPASVGLTMYPSPRNVERALRLWASFVEGGASPGDQQIARLALEGSIGTNATAAYLAILRVRDRIASVEEILADPNGARVPTDTDTGIASMGVVAQVATKDAGAAWLYARRLSPEIRVSLISTLNKYAVKPGPHAAEGTKAKISIMADFARASAGASRRK